MPRTPRVKDTVILLSLNNLSTSHDEPSQDSTQPANPEML